LTSDFRLHYSQLWTGILDADTELIKNSADSLGVGKLYGLLACMLTGRSWNSIQKGIDRTERNKAEVRKNSNLLKRLILKKFQSIRAKK